MANDSTKYTVTFGSLRFERLHKRQTMLKVIQLVADHGATTAAIKAAVPWRQRLLVTVPGRLDAHQFLQAASSHVGSRGGAFDPTRWYIGDADLVHTTGETSAVSTQWGKGRMERAVAELIAAFIHLPIRVEAEPT